MRTSVLATSVAAAIACVCVMIPSVCCANPVAGTGSGNDANRAAKDGEAAGRLFLQMIGDGEFSRAEQDQMETILPGYYAFRIIWDTGHPDHIYRFGTNYRPASLPYLDELCDDVKQGHSPNIARIEFWPNPSPGVSKAAEKRASEAMRRIARRIFALKHDYPELSRFELFSIHLSDSGFWYAPSPPDRQVKFAKPMIVVAVGPPCLVGVQFQEPRVILPRQKLEVGHMLALDDPTLKSKIVGIIQAEIQSLLDSERSLGGEPIQDGSDTVIRSGSARQPLFPNLRDVFPLLPSENSGPEVHRIVDHRSSLRF